jgi:hypothetical protein
MLRTSRIRTPLLAAATALAAAAVPTLVAGSASAAPPETAGRTFHVALTGAAERPEPGDPDGAGTATVTLNPGLGRICYTLKVSGIAAAAAAHIHEAPADQAGPVVVGLMAPTSGMSNECKDVDRKQIRDILRDPAGYYVNVHNADYPAGALRGQLRMR